MSAFAVIFERSNAPVEPGALKCVMERLSHRGPDGSNAVLAGNVALGHWHFWTTPEEAGEQQPLELEGMPYKIVLDGRLDNRPELLNSLNFDTVEGKHLSDAALILYAYAHWGEHCFEHFIGDYALAILDEDRRELICARDSLGERTLFYTFKGTRLVVASEPWAVSGVYEPGFELNESALAHYFAMKATQDGQTLFTNVYELQPAHVMAVSGTGQRRWRYWQPDPSIRLHGRSDEEYAEQFRLLLEESVRCRLRASTPVGSLMSGGLDSPSVACLAARMQASQPFTTISYVFDELAECDERRFIDAAKKLWGLRSIQITCDDAWPLKDWQNWPRNPNQPEGNAYRLLKERAYHQAQTEGMRVLLNGDYGDHLYLAGWDCLTDLVTDGHWLDAFRELWLQIRNNGISQNLAAGHLRRTARSIIDSIPGGKRLHRKQTAPSWLTPLAASYLFKVKPVLDPAFERYANLLGMWVAQDSPREIYYANHHTLELRSPYRDRRLIEFVLTLPAYQLHYHGLNKHILRTAMQGILPEAIRTRRQRSTLNPLFFRGVEREKKVLMNSLQDPKATWYKFVRPDWLMKHWNGQDTSSSEITESIVRWLCISYETWYKSIVSSN